MLSDDANFVGSTSNILTLNNLSASDNYYVDCHRRLRQLGHERTATNTVITTPTAPFFTDGPLNLTNNLFFKTGFTNPALGTGPLIINGILRRPIRRYNTIINFTTNFAPLAGQTNSALSLILPIIHIREIIMSSPPIPSVAGASLLARPITSRSWLRTSRQCCSCTIC